MDAQSIARLMTAGLAAPTGADDTGLYTGVVLSWDEVSGVNSISVNGVAMSNLRVIRSGVGVAYQPGDTVSVQRKGTQYFIQGRIDAPGGNNANLIRYAETSASETTTATSYGNLATVGPVLTSVSIGSSRRFLLMVNVYIQALCNVNTLGSIQVGGSMTVNITGASTVSVVGTTSASWWTPTNNFGGGGVNAIRTFVLTAGNGINPGLHDFTAQYLSTSSTIACSFSSRAITVIPF